MPDRMPERMPDRMPDRMSDRMSNRMPDRMSDRVPDVGYMFMLFCPPSRWGLLDFKIALLGSFTFFFSSSPPRQLLIAVGTAGPQLPAPASSRSQWAPLDLNNHLPISVGTAGPQPESSRVEWAPLDLNRGPPEPSGHCWTSTGDLPSPSGHCWTSTVRSNAI